MILDRLLDLRARLSDDDVPPEAHKRQRIRWVLDVGADGRVNGLTETATKRDTQLEELAPYVKRTSATRPLLLVDKPDYVLGLPEGDALAGRAAERHTAYLALLAEAAAATGDDGLATVHATLCDSEQIERARALMAAEKWAPGDLVAPSVGGAYPHRSRAVQRFWQERTSGEWADKSGLTAPCLLCGRTRPIAKTHPIELMVRGTSVGLVTANKAAFESYGLRQSEVAPMCLDCARGYGEAFRYLIQSDAHSLYVGGGATWLFWTREPVPDFDPAGFFSNPDPGAVSRLLRAARTGHLPDLDANDFYALVVSPYTGRLVVRDWLAVRVAEAHHHLARYFERQRVADSSGECPPLKLLALAGATVRDLKDLAPQVADAILAHALTGRQLPVGVLHLAVQRARAEKEHPVSRPRAALIRLVLASLRDIDPSRTDLMTTEALAPDHPSAAYHCGRLLAVLDAIQRRAISPNATLVDRFYGSAATTPAAVFGTLIQKAQPHLAKLRKGRGGKDHYLDARIGDIAKRIASFPTTLSPEEQGLFALGFYQEKYRPYVGHATDPQPDSPEPDADTPDPSETEV